MVAAKIKLRSIKVDQNLIKRKEISRNLLFYFIGSISLNEKLIIKKNQFKSFLTNATTMLRYPTQLYLPSFTGQTQIELDSQEFLILRYFSGIF